MASSALRETCIVPFHQGSDIFIRRWNGSVVKARGEDDFKETMSLRHSRALAHMISESLYSMHETQGNSSHTKSSMKQEGWAWNLTTSWGSRHSSAFGKRDSKFTLTVWQLVGWPHSRLDPSPKSNWPTQIELNGGQRTKKKTVS